jgi:hypothetical protein
MYHSSFARPILPPPQHRHHGIHTDMALTKPQQWHSAHGFDAPPPLPSPPMTDSPTSPNQSQFPEERPVPAVSSYPAATPVTTNPIPESTGMASQVLAPPSSLPPYQFSAPPPAGVSYQVQTPESLIRQRSQSIPPYSMSFLPSAQAPPSFTYGHMPGVAPQLYSSPLGPAGIGGQSRPHRGGMRRAKAHVARACQNCKRAHLSCDENRPCNRCVATRKEVRQHRLTLRFANRAGFLY